MGRFQRLKQNKNNCNFKKTSEKEEEEKEEKENSWKAKLGQTLKRWQKKEYDGWTKPL